MTSTVRDRRDRSRGEGAHAPTRPILRLGEPARTCGFATSCQTARPGNGTCVQICMSTSMLSCMPSTSVRIDRETHEELKRLASELGTTVGEAVAIAARRLRQQRIGKELSTLLTRDEVDWLD